MEIADGYALMASMRFVLKELATIKAPDDPLAELDRMADRLIADLTRVKFSDDGLKSDVILAVANVFKPLLGKAN